MEEKPIRFEKREENGEIVFGAVFEVKTEEFRKCSEEDARRYYDNILDLRANALTEIDSLSEQVDKYELELKVYGQVFEEDVSLLEEDFEESEEQ